MISCPHCEYENIEGEDRCDQCGQPLADLHLSDPQTAIERGLMRDRLSALQPKPPLGVAAKTPVRQVLQLLVERRIGCVLILDEGQPIGIFSERDALLRLNVDAAAWHDRPISEFMTTNIQTLEANAKVAFAVRQMDLGGFRHVPVVDEQGRAIGVISVRDILRYFTDRFAA